MKKIITLILIFVVVIMCIIFQNFVQYRQQKIEIKKLNNEFLVYQNTEVKINSIVTAMNKAIDENRKNQISQDEKNIYQENDTNSIKVYIELKSRNSMIPMEDLLLNENAGMEKVLYAFSDLTFKITNIEYHKKTGQVKKVVFTGIEELN